MAFRLVDELVHQYEAEVTVVLPSLRNNWAPKIAEIGGIQVIESDRLDEATLRRAGVTEATALGLLDQEDAGNVDAALLAQELNPKLRLVVRMSNQGLGERIAQLLNDCVVLSAAAIAAPAFVAAALDESTSPPIEAGGRTLVATRRAGVATADIVTSLATADNRIEPEMLPDPPAGDLVLAVTRSTARPRPVRRRRQRGTGAMAVIFGARLRVILALVFGIFLLGTAALLLLSDKYDSFSQAAYVAFLTEIGGANIDPTASGIEKVTLTVLSVVAIALIPALTAAIVDSAVRARLRREAGAPTEEFSDHIVVVGLGHVGTRVIRSLHQAGIDVVAIERRADASGVQVARELGIPVIIGDASRAEVLDAAYVARARALVVVSTDDVTNLEISLIGRTAKPDLRVVLRLFDGEFADRVQRAFAINISRSVSYLAAPAFAAAMLGRQIIATIPIKRRVLLVAEIPIGAGSDLEGRTVDSVQRVHAARLIAVASGTTESTLWAVPPGRRLTRGDRLIVVATRAGLSSLVADASARPIDAEEPFRLLDPAERPTAPQPRDGASTAASPERTAAHPPVGPGDGGGSVPA